MKHTHLEIKSDTALTIIKNFNAVAKTVRSSSTDSRCWDYLLDQLNDPETIRPIKTLDSSIDRNRIFSPTTGLWSSRDVNSKIRGATKETKFTKKSSGTLLSPNGKIKLFRQRSGEDVGFLFDLERCSLKPDYIFKENITSDFKPWLRDTPSNKLMLLKQTVSLDALRRQMLAEIETYGFCRQHNELLPRYARDAAIGVFATENNLPHRMAAFALQQHTEKKSRLTLPIFIITATEGIIEYTPDMRQRDITESKNMPLLLKKLYT